MKVLGAVAVAAMTATLAYGQQTIQPPGGPRILVGHPLPVLCVAFSPDGKRFYTGSKDQTVQVWDAETGQPQPAFKDFKGPVFRIAISPDGETLATAERPGPLVKLWDTITRLEVSTLEGLESEVYSLAFTPDGASIVVGTEDGKVVWFDVETGTKGDEIKAHLSPVLSIAFSPDGKKLLTSSSVPRGPKSRSGEAKLWDLATKEPLRIIRRHSRGVECVAYAPDGKFFAAAGSRYADRNTTLWHGQTGEYLGTVKGSGLAAISPDSRLLAVLASRSIVRIWDLKAKKPIALFRGHDGDVTAMAFSPDGRTLVTTGVDRTVRMWSVAQVR